MAPTITAPQARAFISTVRPFTRPSRPISRNVRTRVSPISINIMHHFDMYPSDGTTRSMPNHVMGLLLQYSQLPSINTSNSLLVKSNYTPCFLAFFLYIYNLGFCLLTNQMLLSSS